MISCSRHRMIVFAILVAVIGAGAYFAVRAMFKVHFLLKVDAATANDHLIRQYNLPDAFCDIDLSSSVICTLVRFKSSKTAFLSWCKKEGFDCRSISRSEEVEPPRWAALFEDKTSPPLHLVEPITNGFIMRKHGHGSGAGEVIVYDIERGVGYIGFTRR